MASWIMKNLKAVVKVLAFSVVMVICIKKIMSTFWSILTFFLNLDLVRDFGFYSRLLILSPFFRYFSCV